METRKKAARKKAVRKMPSRPSPKRDAIKKLDKGDVAGAGRGGKKKSAYSAPKKAPRKKRAGNKLTGTAYATRKRLKDMEKQAK